MADQSPCRWVSAWTCEADPDIIRFGMVDLPLDDQVSGGQQLMQLLQTTPLFSTQEPKAKIVQQQPQKVSRTYDSPDTSVTVRHTFIEIVPTAFGKSRPRAISDSYLHEPPRAKTLSMEPLPDLSDASTNVSLESGDQDLSTPEFTYCQEPEFLMNDASQRKAVAFSLSTPAEDWWQSAWTAQGNYDGCVPWSGPIQYDPPAHSDRMNEKTTVMLRNIPNNFTRTLFLELLDSAGFSGKYDFVYLPIDFKSQAGLGYAFVNFALHADADHCWRVFEGFTDWGMLSSKVGSVTWGHPLQGYSAHVERYRDSPVMHASVPEEWKPMIFSCGIRVPFPLPTRTMKAPKLRVRKDV